MSVGGWFKLPPGTRVVNELANEIFYPHLLSLKETQRSKNISPEQVPWEKFYLSICGSFQTGGTVFRL